MSKMRIVSLALACSALLGGCAATKASDDVQAVRTVEVKVPVAVPCNALAQLGVEPIYPDTAKVLQQATDIFEQVRVLLAGREMRMQRLDEYVTARNNCPK